MIQLGSNISVLGPQLNHSELLCLLVTIQMTGLHEVQMDKQLGDVNATEYHLGVVHDVLGVSVTRHLQLQP